MTDDPRARFEALALPLLRPLYNTALRLTRRPEDASDVVQETCLRAYRTFANFSPGTNAKAWLFTIMYSVFVNRYRKEQRAPGTVPLEEAESGWAGRRPASSGQPTLPGPEVTDLAPPVRLALDRLPEAFRSAVLLVDLEELSYEEAAAVLKCPVGTLRSRLFRARRALFLELRPYADRMGYARRSGDSA